MLIYNWPILCLETSIKLAVFLIRPRSAVGQQAHVHSSSCAWLWKVFQELSIDSRVIATLVGQACAATLAARLRCGCGKHVAQVRLCIFVLSN